MRLKKILIIFCFIIFLGNICYGSEEIYDEVSKGFRISDFIKEAKEYTKENFPDFDLEDRTVRLADILYDEILH